ncbi:MAG: hypothetical protein AAGA85_25260 [Bacteroidota bacterium]
MIRALIVICLCGWLPCYGQVDLATYLASPVSEVEVQSLIEQIDYLKGAKTAAPWLREVELRGRVRGLNGGFDDLRLRVSPLNPWVRKTNRAYFEVLEMSLQSQRRFEYSLILESRYRRAIDFIFLSKLSQLLADANAQYEVLSAQLPIGEGAAKMLLRLEKDLLLNELDRIDLEGERELVEQSIRDVIAGQSTDRFAVALDQVIDVKALQSALDTSQLEISGNPELLKEQDRALLSAADLEVNRSESFDNLGFVQAEYRLDSDRGVQENLGFQVGLNLPVTNPDRPDLERRRIELIEDQAREREMLQSLEEASVSLRSELQMLLTKDDLINQKLVDLSRLLEAEITDVDVLLEVEAFKTDLRIRQLRLERSLLETYIQWLQLDGSLTQRPLVNHLYRDKPLLPEE